MSNEEQIMSMLKQNQEIMQRTYESAEKTRKYFLYSLIITIIMFILPLIGLVVIIPMVFSSYMDAFKGL